MRAMAISKFFQTAGIDLMAETEVIQITSNRRCIGYFVPPAIWLDLKRDAEAEQGPADG